MVLVAYSDSEGSDTEEVSNSTVPSKPAPATKSSNNFTVDKANPTKIRVNLGSSLPQSTSDREDGEPAAKRARIGGGGGAFSGFNAMLPAPKRENVKPGITGTNGTKAPARKVFSLKTGAEPAFSREGDAELRDFFAEQEQERSQSTGTSGGNDDETSTIPSDIPKPQFYTESKTSQTTSKPFMFKPLSVSRGPKKKKTASQLMKGAGPPIDQPIQATSTTTKTSTKDDSIEAETATKPKQKMSLFSSGPTELPPDPDPEPEDQYQNDEDDEIVELLDEPTTTSSNPPPTHQQYRQQPAETLTSLANTLNLTPAERRQLLGRNTKSNSTTQNHNIITFNTDTEYASNQAMIANADASVQHNPVRAIAGGKHSLKQLVANAQGQKEALEESFAVGRRNKREAGTKYGW